MRRLPAWLAASSLVFAVPSFAADNGSPNASARGNSSKADTYKQLDLFARVLSYVENNYVEPTQQRELMYGAIQGMLDTLDPHTVFMPPDVFQQMKIDTSGEFGGLGIEVAKKGDAITVVSPIDDTPAARAGVKAGDVLLAIDGESTKSMEVAKAIQKMRGPAGSRVVLSLLRAGFKQALDITVIRDHIRIVAVEGGLYGGVAHIRVKNFQDRTDAALRKELSRLRELNGGKELEGLVLDLRNNPGGLLDQAVALSDRFLPGNLTIVSTRGRSGRNASEERSKDKDTEANYPMVVLVNAGSASASEIVAGALQEHGRATVMGSQTFGKGSVQTVIELEDGSGLKLTIARYYTPKGRSIQERGITPDYFVAEKSSGEKNGGEPMREKDLRHHFTGEANAEVEAPVRPPPPKVPAWPGAAKVSDPPLRSALEYLNAQRSGQLPGQRRAAVSEP